MEAGSCRAVCGRGLARKSGVGVLAPTAVAPTVKCPRGNDVKILHRWWPTAQHQADNCCLRAPPSELSPILRLTQMQIVSKVAVVSLALVCV